MFGRKTLYATVLASSVGVPYALWNGEQVSEWAGDWMPASESADRSPAPGDRFHAYGPEMPNGLAVRPDVSEPAPVGVRSDELPPLAGRPVENLAEVLRFDISPRWVSERWSRVSAMLADPQLDGMRVALVTGTNSDDLSGALTYYFDSDQRVQRITFHGRTGDERKLVKTLTESFQFKQQSAVGGDLYLAKWNTRPTSLLKVRPAAVMWASSPNTRLEVLLEINHPRMRYGLSQTARTLIESERQAKLW